MVTRMSRLPLNTLPTFRTVAELQNLRAAAEALHLTHSAVSQQIRQLEDNLGFALFEREGRRIVLNAAGAAFLCSVHSALTQLEDGVQTARLASETVEKKLRISVVPSFAHRWLLPRLERWHARHPDIALEIIASQQVVDLQRDGFHAAVREGIGPWPGVQADRLFDDPMPLIVVGCAVDARRLVGAEPAMFLKEPLLGDRRAWQAWFAAAGLQASFNTVAEFNDMGLMLQAAEQGLGLTLARELFAADAIRRGKLIRLSPVSVEYDSGHAIHLVYRPALRDWPVLAALREWITEELAASRVAMLQEAEAGQDVQKSEPIVSK
ncbi:LysR family transcriptional regulator [Advenella kashmirensis W13003]|uniref:LysR family transcriptional regulator n=1 Tax=Advenella kashmirensis W13003 TaxID=1424334 RepID=V8QND1_9BURK|nr:LysR substrate-binding domain-containing protein [Advenella kashmirensis]ETF01481.1 LysR family transcriptional regulator [Advenella kashmirensis W13003]